MATHSSTIAWKIPRTEEPGGLQSMGLQRVGHDWATSLLLSLFINYLCLPRWYSGQESACQCSRWKRLRFNPWVQKNCLEKEMATHSSTLAWKIPWTEDPGGLQSMGLQRVGHYWACARARTRTHTHTHPNYLDLIDIYRTVYSTKCTLSSCSSAPDVFTNDHVLSRKTILSKFKVAKAGTSLVVQWLRLSASTVGGTGSNPTGGTKILKTVWCSQNKR